MDIKNACITIRNELSKRGEFYNGFLASIESAIKEAPNYTGADVLSERILSRIIGED